MTKYFMVKYELGEESLSYYNSLNPKRADDILSKSLEDTLEAMQAPGDKTQVTILKETGIGLVPNEKL